MPLLLCIWLLWCIRWRRSVGLVWLILAIAILFCLHITASLIEALLYSLLCLHAGSCVGGGVLTTVQQTSCRIASSQAEGQAKGESSRTHYCSEQNIEKRGGDL